MITPPARMYCFGEFRLDVAARELSRGEAEVSLRRKVFDSLVHLVEHRERVVSRDELIEAVWKTIHLSDSVLGRAVFELRQALADNDEEPRYVKTVRGLGYRWVAPMDVVCRPERPAVPDRVSSAASEVALLLPVAVENGDRHPWIRLGAMDLIAARLRAAGQPMVPSDTAIALAPSLSEAPDRPRIDRLVNSSGAGIVIAAHAEPMVDGWRVSLRALRGSRSRLGATGEARDVLDAAGIAADRFALALGLAPAPAPDAQPGMALLMQQIEAALLAQRMDVALELIQAADPDLCRDPRVRFQRARIQSHGHDLDAAQAAYASLLDAPSIARDPILRAEILSGLGAIHFRKGNIVAAQIDFQEAVRLFVVDRSGETLAERGRSQVRLGTAVALNQGPEAARRHFVQARLLLESTADVVGLAGLDNNLAGLEFQQGRYAEALRYLERAARRFRTLNDVGGELRTQYNCIWSQLNMLEPQAVMSLEPRLMELMAQTNDPALVANARLARGALLAAVGRSREAEADLAEAQRLIGRRADLFEQRASALVLRAEWAARREEWEQAARLATEAIAELPPKYPLLGGPIARARLILVHSRLAERDLAAADEAAKALARWAEDDAVPLATGEVLLAKALVAAASGQTPEAEAAFQQALTFAEQSRVPAILLACAKPTQPGCSIRIAR
jgi:DNA-binding winged helix-turn-helix (wHTH) protein/tetratricopeptide (TPR) repeat protein